MIKRTAFLVTLISGAGIYAAQPRTNPTVSVNANIKISEAPSLPVELKIHVAPDTLVSGLGFASCLAAITLYKKGSELLAFQDNNVLVQRAKHEEGNELIKRSYILFAAGTLAIFNKQILGVFTKQG